MELYCEIGRLISAREEKGTAVAAAGYLADSYPEMSGFSPRYLRRIRKFYRTYEHTPEISCQAMKIGWKQNVVIMEAELALQEENGIFERYRSLAGQSWSCSGRSVPVFIQK